METSVQKLEKSEVKLTVALTEEEMKKYRVKAVKDLQDKVKVPGFRAGKTPEDVLMGEIVQQHPLKYAENDPTVPEIKFKKENEKVKVRQKNPEVKEEEIQAVYAYF